MGVSRSVRCVCVCTASPVRRLPRRPSVFWISPKSSCKEEKSLNSRNSSLGYSRQTFFSTLANKWGWGCCWVVVGGFFFCSSTWHHLVQFKFCPILKAIVVEPDFIRFFTGKCSVMALASCPDTVVQIFGGGGSNGDCHLGAFRRLLWPHTPHLPYFSSTFKGIIFDTHAVQSNFVTIIYVVNTLYDLQGQNVVSLPHETADLQE